MMKSMPLCILFAFAVPLVCCQDCTCGVRSPTTRIVGGNEAGPGEYPWFGYLVMNSNLNSPFCGCTLISKEWMLTAARCLNFRALNDVTAVLGKSSTSDVNSGDFHRLSNMIVHEDYSIFSDDNDIALLHLSEPVNFTDLISPVCLPFLQRDLLTNGDAVTVIGFGQAGFPIVPSDYHLRAAVVTVTSAFLCSRFPNLYGMRITSNMICGGSVGVGSCMFDEGSPLLKEGETGNTFQFGIDSFRGGCGLPGFPGVYTKVANYLEWIKEKTGESFCEI